MAEPPKEDKKFDLSGLPRGAISMRGLPVNRNTRLPSIRSPRDLTLGGPPKRTFMPNIPVRREKKPQPSEDLIKKESIKTEEKSSLQQNDRGKGRRNKKQIIQSQTSIFTEALTADNSIKKERIRDSYSRSEFSSSSRGISIKKEKQDSDVTGISKDLKLLFRDDFIDHDDDFDVDFEKPTVFPLAAEVKKEKEEETVESPCKEFNPDIAKEMDFDVSRVAKFIKKEKGTESPDKKKTVKPAEMPKNEIVKLLKGESSSNLILLQFPEYINLPQKLDDSEPSSSKKSNSADPKEANDQDSSGSIKSLPEGYIGKLLISKSGKVKFVVGNVDYTLDSVFDLKSKHEVASLKTNSSPGDLTMLGQVEHKLSFAPNVDSLIKCFI